MFVREGAIVPLLPEDVQTLCDANYVNNPGISTPKEGLLFLIYPGRGTSRLTVYDGTAIQCRTTGSARSVTLSSAARPVILQVFGNEPAGVARDGQSLLKQTAPADFESATTGWRFDSAFGFLFIKFAHTGGSTQVLF